MVASRLSLKLLRDIKSSPLMFSGVVILLFVGITLFIISYELYLNLDRSYALSYRELHLADFSVQVQSAPKEMVSTLRRIPGIRNVEGRVVQELEIDQPSSESRKVVGRVISIPDGGEPAVNRLKVLSGSYPGRGAGKEILLESSFAKYHGYKPGDYLNIVIQEDKVKFRIVGIVQSPEYIIAVRSREMPMPSPRSFGVMWMRKSAADELLETSGAVNDFMFTVASPDARNTAVRLAEDILEPYGADEALLQEEMPSVEFLKLDLLSFKMLAIFFPLLFLTISSLSVYNILSRMVHAQRSQIGFLRAVGFSRGAVLVHYASFSLAVGTIGGVFGAVLGHYLAILTTRWYTQYIELPFFEVSPKWAVVLGGFGLAVVITTLSGLFPARAAARLAPAEAIGVEVPNIGRAPLIEKYLNFLRRLSLLARLPFRNFLRNPRRTVSSVAGIASGATLLLVSAGMMDSSAAMVDFYFKHSISYDIMASYLNPQTEFETSRMKEWPGVRVVEPVLALPSKLVNGDKTHNILIYGVKPGSSLLTLTTKEGARIPVKSGGLMIAESTAEKLQTWEGGTIRLTLPNQVTPETPELSVQRALTPLEQLELQLATPTYRETLFAPSRALLDTDLDKRIHISSIVYQPIGTTAFAPIEEVRGWYGSALELPPRAVNAVVMTVDPAYVSGVERKLYDTEGIASVEVPRYTLEEINEMMEQSQAFFNVMLLFSIALAGVIIFNSTLMNVIERTREIATLRTLGLSVSAASRMIWVENMLNYAVGMAVGLLFGTWLAGRFIQAYDSESFNMQAVIFLKTYIITAVGILVTVMLVQIPGIRYIRKIELSKATKDVG